MADESREVSIGRNDIDGVTNDTDHLLSVEARFSSKLQRIVRFRDPDLIAIAYSLLTKKSHHGFIERLVDIHVSTRVNASYLF